MKIHADGRVDWVGGANVRVIGEAHGVAERKKLDQLAVTLDLVKFYARESDGHLGKPAVIVVCTDLPSVRISAVSPGQHNAIDYDGCQKDVDLERLVEQLDDVAGIAVWR